MRVELDFKALKAAVAKARGEAYRNAKADWPFVVGRDGALLCTAKENHEQCEPNVAAECPVWDGKKASIEALVADVLTKYPEVATIYIEGAYDGADRLTDREAGYYEPRVEEWEVNVWDRANGYWFAKMTGSPR